MTEPIEQPESEQKPLAPWRTIKEDPRYKDLSRKQRDEIRERWLTRFATEPRVLKLDEKTRQRVWEKAVTETLDRPGVIGRTIMDFASSTLAIPGQVQDAIEGFGVPAGPVWEQAGGAFKAIAGESEETKRRTPLQQFSAAVQETSWKLSDLPTGTKGAFAPFAFLLPDAPSGEERESVRAQRIPPAERTNTWLQLSQWVKQFSPDDPLASKSIDELLGSAEGRWELTRRGFNTLPSAGVQIAANHLVPGAGAIIAYGGYGMQAYQNALAQGKHPDEAEAERIIGGALGAAVSLVQIPALQRMFGVSTKLRTGLSWAKALAIGKAFSANAPVGTVTELLQGLSVEIAGAIKEEGIEFDEGMRWRLLESALMGFIMSSGTTAAGSAYGILADGSRQGFTKVFGDKYPEFTKKINRKAAAEKLGAILASKKELDRTVAKYEKQGYGNEEARLLALKELGGPDFLPVMNEMLTEARLRSQSERAADASQAKEHQTQAREKDSTQLIQEAAERDADPLQVDADKAELSFREDAAIDKADEARKAREAAEATDPNRRAPGLADEAEAQARIEEARDAERMARQEAVQAQSDIQALERRPVREPGEDAGPELESAGRERTEGYTPASKRADTSFDGYAFEPVDDIFWVSPGDVAVHPDMQYKLNIDPKTGVQVPLEGPWDADAGGVLMLWLGNDGTLYVANGHHRHELAAREGVDRYRAAILRESDGIDVQKAREVSALLNIREGRGTTFDEAEFWRNATDADTQRIAKEWGGRPERRHGFTIGKNATDYLYEAWRTGKLTDSQAAAISSAAPQDLIGQTFGEAYVERFPAATKSDIQHMLRNAEVAKKRAEAKRERDKSSDPDGPVLFSEQREWLEGQRLLMMRHNRAMEQARELERQVRLARGAKNLETYRAEHPEEVGKMGWEVETNEDMKAFVEWAESEAQRWRNWADHADLKERIEAMIDADTPLFQEQVRGDNDVQAEQAAVQEESAPQRESRVPESETFVAERQVDAETPREHRVSKDQFDNAKKKLNTKSQRTRREYGLPVDQLPELVAIGKRLLQDGHTNQKDWSQALRAEVGKIHPDYARFLFKHVKGTGLELTPDMLASYSKYHMARTPLQAFEAGRLEQTASANQILDFAQQQLPDEYKLLSKAFRRGALSRTPSERRSTIAAINRMVANRERAYQLARVKDAAKAAHKAPLLPEYKAVLEALDSQFSMVKSREHTVGRARRLLEMVGDRSLEDMADSPYADAESETRIAAIPRRIIDRAKRTLANHEDKTQIRDLPPNALKDLANAFATIVNENRKAQELRVLGEIKQAKRSLDSSVNEMDARGPNRELDPNVQIPHGIGHISQESLKWLNHFLWDGNKSYATMMELLAGQDSELYRVMVDNLRAGDAEHGRLMKGRDDAFEEFGKNTLGMNARQFREWWRQGVQTELPNAVWRGAADRPAGTQNLTRGERMSLYLLWKQSDSHDNLIRNKHGGVILGGRKNSVPLKLTPRDFQSLSQSLTAEERALANFIQQSMARGELSDRVAQTYLEENGVPFARSDDWFTAPRVNDYAEAKKFMDSQGWPTSDAHLDDLSILKFRTGGNTPYLVRDAVDVYFDTTNKMSQYANKWRPARQALWLSSRPEFKESLRRNTRDANDILERIRNTVQMYEGTAFASGTKMDRMMSAIMRNMHVGLLGFRPQIIAYQAGSLVNASAVVPAKYLFNPRAATIGQSSHRALMDNSSIFAERAHGSGLQILNPYLSGRSAEARMGIASTWRTRLQDASMLGIHEMDLAVVRQIYGGAYLQALDQGLSGQEAQQFAIQSMEKAVLETQPVWGPLDTPHIVKANRSNAALRMLTGVMFTSQRAQNANMIIRGLNRVANGELSRVDYAKQVLWILAGNGAYIELSRQAVRHGWRALQQVLGFDTPDKENEDWYIDTLLAIARRSAGNFLVGGETAGAVGERVYREVTDRTTWYGDRKNIASQAHNNINNFIDSMVDLLAWSKDGWDDKGRWQPSRGKLKTLAASEALLRALTVLGIPTQVALDATNDARREWRTEERKRTRPRKPKPVKIK